MVETWAAPYKYVCTTHTDGNTDTENRGTIELTCGRQAAVARNQPTRRTTLRCGQGSPLRFFFRYTNHMTSDSIKTGNKPCPLTVGEWIALLTAESHVIISCKTHLGNTNF